MAGEKGRELLETCGVAGTVRNMADGTVEVDFNKAYNPPCVFTPYATCTLPWPANRLPIRIEAGERTYGEH